MNAPFSPLSATDLDAQAAEDAQLYRCMLHELMEIGMDLAREVRVEVKAAAEPGTESGAGKIEKASLAFERISRSVRRTVMLAQRPGEAAALSAGRSRASKKRHVIRIIEDRILAQRVSDDEKETLEAELLERMDGPDIADDIDHRPTFDIIQEICEDLGIDRDKTLTTRKRRTPEDIAVLCAHAAGRRIAANANAMPGIEDMTRPLDRAEAERFYRLLRTPLA